MFIEYSEECYGCKYYSTKKYDNWFGKRYVLTKNEELYKKKSKQ